MQDQAEAGVTVFLNQAQHFGLGIVVLSPQSALAAGFTEQPSTSLAGYVRLRTITANSTNSGASDPISSPTIIPLPLPVDAPVKLQIEAVNRTTYAFRYNNGIDWVTVGWGNSHQVSGGFVGMSSFDSITFRYYNVVGF